MKRRFRYLLVLILCMCGVTINAGVPQDEFCGIRNTTFNAGEELTYTVFYAVAGIYVNAGTAVFTNSLERFNGKTVYHITGAGSTNTSYDWIYKVRDKYETMIDTSTMLPLKFIRNVQEGAHKQYENITFN